jgi:hypothetical protein
LHSYEETTHKCQSAWPVAKLKFRAGISGKQVSSITATPAFFIGNNGIQVICLLKTNACGTVVTNSYAVLNAQILTHLNIHKIGIQDATKCYQ